MAGDLLILDLSYDDIKTLEAAGATVGNAIYHADKSWTDHKATLEGRLGGGGPSNRANLPAHAYVTFAAANRGAVAAYCGNPIQKLKLKDLLDKFTRPLGVVTANPHLAPWPGANAADTLTAALNRGNVIIEYYKYDGAQLLDVHGKDDAWAKHDE